jgi:hypothetical protein
LASGTLSKYLHGRLAVTPPDLMRPLVVVFVNPHIKIGLHFFQSPIEFLRKKT